MPHPEICNIVPAIRNILLKEKKKQKKRISFRDEKLRRLTTNGPREDVEILRENYAISRSASGRISKSDIHAELWLWGAVMMTAAAAAARIAIDQIIHTSCLEAADTGVENAVKMITSI